MALRVTKQVNASCVRFLHFVQNGQLNQRAQMRSRISLINCIASFCLLAWGSSVSP